MEVKLVCSSKDGKLDIIEFRFGSGISLYSESFVDATEEYRKTLHKEVRDIIQAFKDLGLEIKYDLGNLKAASAF